MRMLKFSNLLVIGIFTLYAGANSHAASSISADEGLKNERDFLRSLQPELHASGKFGRVYYSACGPNDSEPVPFPKLTMQLPSKSSHGLVAIKEIFRGNSEVNISEDEKNIVRIKIGHPPETLLRTRISKIYLNPMQQYNYSLAIGAIESAPDVSDVIRASKLKLPQISPSVLLTEPNQSQPHLPAVMTNITVDQAMDDVASTFKGIVFYGICIRQNLFDIGFVSSF